MVRTEQVWYSARSWKKPIWHSLTRATMFDEVLAGMEKVNVRWGDPWKPYVFVPGIFGHSKFDEVLRSLER